MAFGITRNELLQWKNKVSRGEISFLTHYWQDSRFPHYTTVTKVGCNCISTLIQWGKRHNLSPKWIHEGKYPHFDLMGKRQYEILLAEELHCHIEKFNLFEQETLK